MTKMEVQTNKENKSKEFSTNSISKNQIPINDNTEHNEKAYQQLIGMLGYEPYLNWVERYWTTRGEPLDFEEHGYLQGIYADQSPTIVYKKSAQVGLTERMVTEAMWISDQFSENAIYIYPTSGTISDVVQERVDEPLNNSVYLRRVTGRSKKILGKQADKVGLKRLSKGFVYFRGANKPTQITSVPADIVFVDELDRMIPENVPYFDKRLEHSNRGWERWASTPTIPEFGIDEKYLKSDQHEYHVKCDGCSTWLLLNFWDNVEHKQNGESGIVTECRIFCNHCKKTIEPWRLEGKWVKGKDNMDARGYHISQLYSPRLNLKKMVTSSLKNAEWEVMQFYNQNLGLAYEPKGAKLTELMLLACMGNYSLPVIDSEEATGVDVGKVLHVVTRSKSRITDIRTIKHFSSDEGEDNLIDYLKARNIKKVVIDALPETRSVQKVIKALPGKAFLCYYSGLKEVKENEWYRVSDNKVNTDRTLSLDMSLAEIKNQAVEYPQNIKNNLEFKNHMKSLIRVVSEDSKGNKKAEYVKRGEDHYAHANNYAKIASDILTRKVKPEIFSL